jgi:deoxyhypusine synthase
MGVAAMAGVKMPEQLIDRVYNCCVPHDPICQIDGTIMNHLTYAGQHANDASNFVMIQLKRKLLHKTGHK